MTTKNEAIFNKDPDAKKITVVRKFDAPVADVWKAWTDASLLGEWWAPKPWKAVTVKMDFREGGTWLYYMSGPAGEKHYCRVDFTSIEDEKSFTSDSYFSDESGNRDASMPAMHWKVLFKEEGSATRVEAIITFDEKGDMDKYMEMGFQGGFTMALGNLDEVLAK